MSRPYESTLADDAAVQLGRWARWAWDYARGPGRARARVAATRGLHRAGVNLQARRVLSFPHVLVVFWLVVLLWGERWVFESKVDDCAWHNWEEWVGQPQGLPPELHLQEKLPPKRLNSS